MNGSAVKWTGCACFDELIKVWGSNTIETIETEEKDLIIDAWVDVEPAQTFKDRANMIVLDMIQALSLLRGGQTQMETGMLERWWWSCGKGGVCGSSEDPREFQEHSGNIEATFSEVQLMKVVFFSPFLVVANETAVEVRPDRCDADCFCLNTVESAQTQNDSLTNCFEHERLSKKQRSADTQSHPVQSLLGFLGVFVKTLCDIIQRQQHPLQSEIPNKK